MSTRAHDIHIDRLALRVTGLSEDTARTLARLVAEGLVSGELQAARAARAGGLSHLRIDVQADAGQGEPDLLARRIVAEIGRELARGRVPGGQEGQAVP
jgi:hypothetical protein